jgi:hypothetical protein
MGFASTYDVAVDDAHVFRKQVAGALHSIACDIIAEAPETDDHANRLNWARRVTANVDGPVTEAAKWIWLMLTNATFAANPTGAEDGAVKTIATSFLSIMVGR